MRLVKNNAKESVTGTYILFDVIQQYVFEFI